GLAIYPILRGQSTCPHTPQGASKLDERLGCDGVPFSHKVPDACGVCGGDGSSCLNCAGELGTAQRDACGVCGGDGSSCRQCARNMMPDECGRCVLATVRYPYGGYVKQSNLLLNPFGM